MRVTPRLATNGDTPARGDPVEGVEPFGTLVDPSLSASRDLACLRSRGAALEDVLGRSGGGEDSSLELIEFPLLTESVTRLAGLSWVQDLLWIANFSARNDRPHHSHFARLTLLYVSCAAAFIAAISALDMPAPFTDGSRLSGDGRMSIAPSFSGLSRALPSASMGSAGSGFRSRLGFWFSRAIQRSLHCLRWIS